MFYIAGKFSCNRMIKFRSYICLRSCCGCWAMFVHLLFVKGNGSLLSLMGREENGVPCILRAQDGNMVTDACYEEVSQGFLDKHAVYRGPQGVLGVWNAVSVCHTHGFWLSLRCGDVWEYGLCSLVYMLYNIQTATRALHGAKLNFLSISLTLQAFVIK